MPPSIANPSTAFESKSAPTKTDIFVEQLEHRSTTSGKFSASRPGKPISRCTERRPCSSAGVNPRAGGDRTPAAKWGDRSRRDRESRPRWRRCRTAGSREVGNFPENPASASPIDQQGPAGKAAGTNRPGRSLRHRRDHRRAASATEPNEASPAISSVAEEAQLKS